MSEENIHRTFGHGRTYIKSVLKIVWTFGQLVRIVFRKDGQCPNDVWDGRTARFGQITKNSSKLNQLLCYHGFFHGLFFSNPLCDIIFKKSVKVSLYQDMRLKVLQEHSRVIEKWIICSK